MLLYNRFLDGDSRDEVQKYLNRKYRITPPDDQNWSTIATGLSGNTSYTDDNLDPFTCYYYRVVPVADEDGTPGPALGVTTLPSAPLAPPPPFVRSVGSTYATLLCPSVPPRATSLSLQYKLTTDPDSAYTTVVETFRGQFKVTGLSPQTVYSFRCVALGEGGSTPGNAREVTTTE